MPSACTALSSTGIECNVGSDGVFDIRLEFVRVGDHFDHLQSEIESCSCFTLAGLNLGDPELNNTGPGSSG
jgi:hypothetical protein